MSKLSKVQPSPMKFDKAFLVTRKEIVPVQLKDVSRIVVRQQITAEVNVKTVDPGGEGEE